MSSRSGRDYGHTVGDARKRLTELPNHDEVAAHCDVDWSLLSDDAVAELQRWAERSLP